MPSTTLGEPPSTAAATAAAAAQAFNLQPGDYLYINDPAQPGWLTLTDEGGVWFIAGYGVDEASIQYEFVYLTSIQVVQSAESEPASQFFRQPQEPPRPTAPPPRLLEDPAPLPTQRPPVRVGPAQPVTRIEIGNVTIELIGNDRIRIAGPNWSVDGTLPSGGGLEVKEDGTIVLPAGSGIVIKPRNN